MRGLIVPIPPQNAPGVKCKCPFPRARSRRVCLATNCKLHPKAWTGDVVEAFPELNLGENTQQPIDMRMTPDGTKWWLVDMEGQIFEVRKPCPLPVVPRHGGTTHVLRSDIFNGGATCTSFDRNYRTAQDALLTISWILQYLPINIAQLWITTVPLVYTTISCTVTPIRTSIPRQGYPAHHRIRNCSFLRLQPLPQATQRARQPYTVT